MIILSNIILDNLSGRKQFHLINHFSNLTHICTGTVHT